MATTLKEQMEDELEKKGQEELANQLGITYDELCQTEYEIDTDKYYVSYVVFSELPDDIAEKIRGLRDNRVLVNLE